MASLLRSNIQDFVQEVPVGQMAQGTPFRCLLQGVGGGKGEVKPPTCPTRQSGLADTILYYTILYYTILYYTILYYTILYYTILYYTILY